MKKGRLKRNKLTILSFLIALAIGICSGINPSKINNYTDVMSAALSFSSIATALFISSFSLMPAFSNSKFIKMLQSLGTDIKIMDRLLISTLIFFVSSMLSFIALFLKSTETCWMSNVLIVLWLATTVAAFFSTFYIIFLLIKSFEIHYKTEES